MSLINDMLKNLEKRYEQTQKTFATHSFEAEEEESIFLKAFIVALVLVAGVILIFAGHYFYKHPWHFHHDKKTQVKAKVVSAAPAVSTTNATQTTPPSAAAPSIIANGFHINDLPGQTEVEIDLTAPPTFVTNTDASTNTVSVTIDNASLSLNKICHQLGKGSNCISNNQIPLPINTTAIKAVHIDQNDGQALVLAFQLASPTAQLQDAHVSGNDLLITFSKTGNGSSNNSNAIDVSTPAATPPATTDNANAPVVTAGPLPLPSGMSINAGPTDSDQMLQPVSDKQLLPNTPYEKINNYIYLKQLALAEQAINNLSTSEKNSMQGLMSQAKLQLAYGNNTKALAILESKQFDNPSPDFYALYAAILEFNKKHGQAVVIYKKLVDYWPDNNNWWLGLGIAAANDHQDALATTAYHHLLATSNLTPEVDNFVRSQLETLTIINQNRSFGLD